MNILSFNIRCSYGDGGTPNIWKNRREACLDVVREGDYDFVGLQEVVWNPDDPDGDQAGPFRDRLPEYGFLGRSRNADPASGEGVVILYRRDRWEPDPAQRGTVWLSETPDIPGSASWDTFCPRTLEWGRFHELRDGRRTGRSLVFANTHLDYVLEHTQLQQAGVVARLLAPFVAAGDAVALTGDFNAYEVSWPVHHLLGRAIHLGDAALPPVVTLRDAMREAAPDAPDGRTYHNWCNGWTLDRRIDYIFFAGPLAAAGYAVDRRPSAPDGHYPSDHYPIRASFRWEERA